MSTVISPAALALPPTAEARGEAEGLDEQVARLSVIVHALTAELARLTADLDASGSWADWGIPTSAHWLALNTGFDLHTGAELVRVGTAMQALPACAKAFGAGELSFDKVRTIARWPHPPTRTSGSNWAARRRRPSSAVNG